MGHVVSSLRSAFDGGDYLAGCARFVIHSTPRDRNKVHGMSKHLAPRGGCPSRRDIDGADAVIYGAASSWTDKNQAMMYLDTPPRLIGTKVFWAMPDASGARAGVLDAPSRGVSAGGGLEAATIRRRRRAGVRDRAGHLVYRSR